VTVTPDLRDLLPSWIVVLRAEHKAANTVRSYRRNVSAFLDRCDQQGIPARLDRRTVTAHLADMLAGGAQPTSVKIRHGALRRFSAWLADEGEIDRDDLLGVHPPRVPIKVIQQLTDDELRRLLADCATRKFTDLRDAAILRLALETGMRAGELLGLRVEDVDVVNGTAIVRTSKTGTGRLVGFSPTAAKSLDRYLRARRAHRLAATGKLFLGQRGQDLKYAGLAKQFRERAERAGVEGFHMHRLRHTAAIRWLGRGGSERGLMSLAGWKDGAMLRRYAAAAAGEQAVEESRRLDLGEL
jgi:integrase/recombinase XerD